MKTQDNQLLEESIAWINEHQNAANSEVPDRLVAAWLAEGQDIMNDLSMQVFMFGLLQAEHRRLMDERKEISFIPDEKLWEYFQRWRLKLALSRVNRCTEIGLSPLPLFSFPENEKVHYFSKTDRYNN